MCGFHSFANCLVNLQFYTIYSCAAVLFLSFYAEETGAEESTPFLTCLGCHFSCSVCPDDDTVSSFFVSFIVWLDIFAFMLHTMFILVQCALYIVCKSDNYMTSSLSMNLLNFMMLFTAMLYSCIGKSLQKQCTACGKQSSLHTFFPVHHSLLAKHFKNCVICSFFAVTFSLSFSVSYSIMSMFAFATVACFAAVKIQNLIFQFFLVLSFKA